MEIQPKSDLHLAQQDVFYAQLLKPESPLYNIGGYIVFKGYFNINHFKTALRRLPSTFDSYNLKYDFSEITPKCFLSSAPEDIILNEIDFSENVAPKETAIKWMQSQFNTPFNIYKSPLYKSSLLKISDNEFWWFGCFHHLFTDGYGFTLIADSVISSYDNLCKDVEISEIASPTYLNAIKKSNEYLQSKFYETDKTYWSNKFKAIPEALLQPNVSSSNEEGARHSVIISDSDRALFNSLSKHTNANLSQFTLAALIVYFGKTKQKKEFTFGTPIHNRASRVERKTLGMFSSILPFKGKYDPDQSIVELISSIKKEQRNDYRHRSFPISHLNRSLQLSSEKRSRLYDITVNYEPFPFPKSLDSGLHIETKHLNSTTDLLNPLSFRWCDYGEDSSLELNIDYILNYFHENEIPLIANRLLHIIRQFALSLDTPVKDISIIPKNELQKLVAEFNTSTFKPTKDESVLDLFEKQVQLSPQSTALTYNGQQLSYQELNRRSNQLAHFLKENKVKSNDIVGLLTDKSFEMIIGILGILKAGAAYVPISSEYPQERIKFIIRDTKLSVLLHTTNISLKNEVPLVINLNNDWDKVSSFSKNNLYRDNISESLAYVIYTSGTTGTPKGVMINHNSLNNYIQYQSKFFNFHSKESVLQFSNFVFDASIEQFFLALINGATLVIPSKDEILDTEKLHTLLIDKKVTHIHATPSYLQQLGNLDSCTDLKRIVSGGEVCPLNLAQKIPSNVDFYNKYGPTEATISATEYKFDPASANSTVLPIGRPIANMELYILNNKNEVCPIGVSGELCISGIGLSTGYLNNKELTKEKFVKNPLKKDSIIYKTGDNAKWLPDGTIEFIGRIDNQVKIRGHRIELGEIESALFKLPEVKNCAILTRKDNQKNNILIGYVVLNDSGSIETIKKGLKESLPEYMIPTTWVSLESIPLTANGKLDKSALPETDINIVSEEAYMAPSSPLEIELATLWQNILGVPKVGIKDNFFKLGGHSILVIQLISELRSKGYRLEVKDIFNSPTIEEISLKIEVSEEELLIPWNQIANENKEITPSMVPLAELNKNDLYIITKTVSGGVENIQDIYSLSPLQEGIYYHHLLSSKKEGDPYIFSSLFSFETKDDRKKFTEALQEVIKRHDVLRTCFISENITHPVQVVLKEVELSLETLKLNNTEDILTQVKSIIADGKQWIDVSKGPLINIQYANDESQDKFYLVFNEHHLISDHVGLSKLIQEIDLILSNKDKELAKPKLYREFIFQIRNQKNSHKAQRFFENLYQEIDEPSYPFNLSDTATPVDQIKEENLLLSKKLNSEIRLKCQLLGISPASFFHAAFGIVIGQSSNTNYALFGSLFSGRLQSSTEVSDSLGLFINTLPVLIPLKGTVKEYLKEVHQNLNSLIPFEQTSISEIHNWSPIPNDTPIVSAVLNYRHSSTDLSVNNTITLGGTRVTIVDAIERGNYPFFLNVDDYGDSFKLNAQLHQSIAPERLLNYMQITLNQLLSGLNEDTANVSDISILPNHEQQLLIHNFNDTNFPYPDHKTIIDLFIEQVKKSPNSIAVAYKNETLTYDELNKKSNQLAHYLIKKGTKQNNLIGISVDKSINMIIGILGILKSGAAYVPIDSNYPQKRIDYILNDTKIDILLIDETSINITKNHQQVSSIKIDDNWKQFNNSPIESPSTSTSPSDLAYVIYTSGSTGNPKGVMIENKSVINLIHYQSQRFGIDNTERISQFSNYVFDASVEQIFLALLNGSVLVLVPKEVTLNSDRLTDFINHNKITHFHATPSYLSQLENLEKCKTLKRIISGGESCSLELAKKLANITDFYNEYGPTETTVTSTELLFSPENNSNKLLSIGTPIGNTKVLIVNENNHIQPIGAFGELCLTGDGLARGYLNQPELTTQKFIQNPLNSNERMYKSGDLARWLPNGTLEFLGRIDNQVKIRGYRIELGEIESTMLSIKGIQNGCVLALKDINNLEYLVGYVVSETTINKDEIIEELKQTLPEYMVPKVWIQIDTLPLTTNGKLDKRALPQPSDSIVRKTTYIAPKSKIEEDFVNVWQNILGIDQIGIADNFFELGGHSLLIVKIISQLKNAGYSVEIKDIFENPTIETLSKKVNTETTQYCVPKNGITTDSIEITPSMVPLANLNQKDLDVIANTISGKSQNIQDIYTLSPLQEGIYFHHMLSSPEKGDSYLIPSLFSFNSSENRSRFIEALQKVIDRHDVLRTCFLGENLSQPVQVVQRKAKLIPEELNLNVSNDILGELKTLVTPGNQWMDITQAPLINAKYADDPLNNNYYLIVNRHHLISDHIGLEKMILEIKSFLTEKSAELPTPTLYRDFIGRLLHQREVNNPKTYFTELYKNIIEPSYPFNLSNTLTDINNIKESELVLPKEINNEIRRICKEHFISPASFFHAAFAIVVAKCSNTDYALFGSLFSGRFNNATESSNSLGLCINTLPVLINIEGTVLEYIQKVNTHLQGLLPYEQTSISDIHKWSAISNGTPFISSLFNYRHTESALNHGDIIKMGTVEMSYLDSYERSNYPFSLNVDDFGNAFKLNAQVDNSLHPERLVSYMLEALKRMLKELRNNNTLSISNISILPNSEKQQLIVDFNDTNVTYTDHLNLIDLFVKQVVESPDSIAIVYNGLELTYKDLDQKSNQLANYLLASKNIQLEEPIAVILERNPWLIISFLGILKAGGVYVPIDSKFPEERQQYILDDSNSKIIIDQPFIETFEKEINKHSKSLPKVAISMNNLAYIIYTSGSTGKPKGVMIEHKGIVNTITALIPGFSIHKNSKNLQFASPSFDASICETLTSLLSGSALYIIEESKKSDVNFFTNFINEYGITSAIIPPAYLQLLEIEKLNSLETIISAGESISLDLAERISNHCNFVNAYGPTETSICATLFKGSAKSLVSIGTPINNTQVYLLDDNNTMLPLGVTGELCIAGTSLARGYLNKDVLTSEKFIQNPFSNNPENKLYKTGDLARWLPDGNLEFMGRTDDQVKIRGYRIELGEIENTLSTINGVIQHAILPLKNKNNTNNLVAYVVLEKDVNKNQIQEALKKQLPEYMVPSIWIEMDGLPITTNGKVDKKALPKPSEDLISSSEYEAPRNKTEHQLVLIWQELLSIEKLGIHDDFFELGGHSLLATRLVSRIRTDLGFETTIKAVFEYKTIASFYEYITSREDKDVLPLITAQNRGELAPLSFSQERLSFIDKLQGTTEYHMNFIVKLKGEIHADILEKSLQYIIQRHQALRTLLVEKDEEEFQKIISMGSWKLHQECLRGKSIEDRIKRFVTTPFDLYKDIKLRAALFEVNEREFVFACIFHHIASDGWSMKIFIDELSQVYNSYLKGETPELQELNIQYSDYATWQRTNLEGNIINKQLTYWENKLKDTPSLSFPTDFQRPAKPSSEAASESIELDLSLSNSLNEICSKENVTLFMLMLTGYKVLLSRYSNQEDICIGTPIANRTQTELENMIGFFVNTLALRTDLSGNLTFNEILSQVKTTTLDAYDHQLTPFEKVVEKVVTKRDLNTTPLFQTLFSLQNTSSEKHQLALENIETINYSLDRISTKFDFTLDVLEVRGKLKLVMGYRTCLFKKETISRFLSQYKTLLESIVKNRHEFIHSLPIISSKEKEALLNFNTFNKPILDYTSIVDQIEKKTLETPKAIALSLNNNELSYEQLNEKSNQLAGFLKNKGVKSNDLVAISIDRSFEMIIGILGILKAEAAYVPIDPTFPQKRIDFILNDIQVKVLLVDQKSISIVHHKENIQVISLDENWNDISRFPKANMNHSFDKESLAYVIYTSGSTGTPKGVKVGHKSLSNYINYQSKTFKIDPEERILQFSNFVFDASVEQLFLALTNGSTLVLTSKEVILDPVRFCETLSNQNITHLHATPSYLTQLTDLPNCESLKRVVSGGEMCNLELTHIIPENTDFFNKYGPTEATISITEHQYDASKVYDNSLPIGKPINNSEIYILNKNNQLQPIGVAGELCVSGDCLSFGYLNNEKLTQEKFVSNPFKKNSLIYKTGDLAKWLPDGNIQFIGRIDEQVKIRGYRIELGEIDSALSTIKGVIQHSVLAVKNKNNINNLVAYIVLEKGINKQFIQEELKQQLPEYMVPSIWIELEAMPITTNGKIDKKALPKPNDSLISTSKYQAPRNETEKQLTLIWQELLSIEKIGIHDDFFELGGHSLLATRLASKIRSRLKFETAIKEVFEYKTIASFHDYITSRKGKQILPALVPQNQDEYAPLSFSQERLWFIDKLQGSTEYHMPFIVKLKGNINVDILEKSLRYIIERHRALRTLLIEKDGEELQKVIPSNSWQLHKEQLSNSMTEEYLKQFVMTPFDFSVDFKIRATLIETGKKEFVFVCVFHHVASDGWSTKIFINELNTVYNSFTKNETPKLQKLDVHYSDYAIWQRNNLEGGIINDQLTYWENKLQNTPNLWLPTDFTRPSQPDSNGATASLELDVTLSNSLHQLSSEENVTLFMLMLTGYKVFLSRYSNQEDICVGTPIANRTQTELENMIGFFVNTLALRSDLSGNRTFHEILNQVKNTTLDAYDNQLAPFEKVVEKVVSKRDISTTPLFQTLFSLQNKSSKEHKLTLQNIEAQNYSQEKKHAKFDLTLNIFEIEGRLKLVMGYRTSLFKKETITQFLSQYKTLLESIVKNRHQFIHSLPILSSEERKTILNFNSPKKPNIDQTSVIDQFEERVQQTPFEVALKLNNNELSYEQLNEKSNQLAHFLKDKGIRSNDLVGISIDRSFDMIVGILGILKSGAAYVPIDPTFPQKRINFILNDTKVKVLLVDNSSAPFIDNSLENHVVNLTENWEGISSYSKNNIEHTFNSLSLAYVIYTSGSTGTPKGVKVGHKSLSNYINHQSKTFKIDSEERILQFSNFVFDASVEQLFLALTNGSTLVQTSKSIILDPIKFCDLLIEEKITHLHATPSYLSQLKNLPNCENLKRVVSGGEVCNIELIKGVPENTIFFNKYGPTEATISVTEHQYDVSKQYGNTLPIGKPIDNADIYVLNKNNQIQPVGVAGELCISGDCLSFGYLNNEKLTQEKFVSNPFKKGSLIYKTGDIVKWLPDGNIEFIGRIDEQVKIRGYRVELGEIETTISNITHVKQACVLAKSNAKEEAILIAYIVLDEGISADNLKKSLSDLLPEYMIPSSWVTLDEIPLTPNGKLDKKALPEPNLNYTKNDDFVAPENEIQEILVEIWQKLLNIEKIGIHNNFFEFGGHSLLVIKMISELRALNYSVEVKDVFLTPTIAGISEKLRTTIVEYVIPENGITAEIKRITPSMVPLSNLNQEEIDSIIARIPNGIENIQDIYTLSPLQEGIYFHHSMGSSDKSDAYLFSGLYSFNSPEDRLKFIEALQKVIDRHDVLRTCFFNEELSQPVQVVQRKAQLINEQLNLTSNNILEELKELVAPGNQWLDVSKAPLVNVKHADDHKNSTYYLIINKHHLISDHIGLEKMIAEVNMFLNNQENELQKPSLYRDFIGATQHNQATNNAESFFKKIYNKVEEASYPFHIQNTSTNVSNIKESRTLLPDDLNNKIRNICKDHKMSPAVLFHAAFGMVVSQCSNTDYAIFGTLFSGRLQNSADVSESIGLCINTLPFYIEQTGNALEYIQKVNAHLNDLLPYEQTSMSNIHKWSAISNDVPLISSLLNYRHSKPNLNDDNKVMMGDIEVSSIDSHERNNYPFSLNVDNLETGFYLTALVDETIDGNKVISYMIEAIVSLIENVINQSDAPINTLSVLPESDQEKILITFNNTDLSYPKDESIIDLFEKQVALSPNNIAILSGTKELSYQELDAKSNNIAISLKGRGVQEGDFVGICLERSIDLIESILGILKCGATYVPLDPEYPQSRIEYIIEDSNINLIITKSTDSEIIFNDSIQLLFVDKELTTKKDYLRLNPQRATLESLAYIMYTSGSTGKPKGVMVNHKNVVSIAMSSDYITLDSSTVWLSTGSVAFDATTIEYWGTLLNGGKLVLEDTQTLLDPNSLEQVINHFKVNTLFMTSSWFHQVVETNPTAFKNLSYLMVGGDIVLFNLTNRLMKQFPKLQIMNVYGPTENTTFSTVYKKTSELESNIPIGKPLKNRTAYIINSNLIPCPIGVVGELCVGGDGVANGYLNKPELTEEKFIQNPFSNEIEKIYKTGDLARWLPDGNIEFIGRIDNQVKIRGYRIELGEIETAISSLPGVIEQCVLVLKNEHNSILSGYLVLEKGITKEKIQEDLKLKIPDYMVPQAWVELESMPLTTNGKIDKKALPKPEILLLSTTQYEAPRNETETALVELWKDLLRIDIIGIHDNFFELGGHSLLATRLVAKIRSELKLEVSIKDVFKFKTIASIFENSIQNASKTRIPSVTPKSSKELIPLSFSQERLWFIDKLQGSTEYHMQFVIELNGRIDAFVLEQSIKHIVKRHEVLRTVLVSENEQEYQQIISEDNWEMQKDIISDKNLIDIDVRNYIQTPFNLSKDYMLRSKLYEVHEEKHILAIVIHHIAGDGWSKGILVDEFTSIYDSLSKGEQPQLPEISIQYSDYAIWQREHLEGSIINEQLNYWKTKLDNVSNLALPADYPHSRTQNTEGELFSLILDEKLSKSLQAICQEEEVTLFMLLLTAFKVLLSRYSNQNDICIGTPIANRTQVELEQMIGFFVNTLALRSNFADNPSFIDALNTVKTTTLEAYDHQLAPFEKVVNATVSERNISTTPLFQVMFALQNAPEENNELRLGDTTISSYNSTAVLAKFDLSLDAYENDGQIKLLMNYRKNLFAQKTINQLLHHYKALLEQIVDNRIQRIQNINFLTEKEEHQLLVNLNNSVFNYPKSKTLAELFKEQVTETPNNIALLYNEQQLTYKELNERANKVAHYLLKQGVKADDFIGICVDRNIEMIIGILGILKAGAAYVPIDAGYPEKRIEHILNDTKTKIVLTDKNSSIAVESKPNISLFRLDEDWSQIENFSKENPITNSKSSDLAYVIYTSGSTGTPKGVMIENRSVVNLIHYQIKEFDFSDKERVLLFSNYVFDASVEQLFLALLSGAGLVLASKEVILNPNKVVKLINKHQITHIDGTPSYLAQLTELENCSSVKRIISGGESCSPELAKKLSSFAELYNEYGPTEATVTATKLQYNSQNNANELVSIGAPIANTEAYIINKENQLQPIGVFGELCLAGDGLARGYLNHMTLTQEKFVNHPFKSGKRMYKTGDIARWLPNGTIEFIGRIDDQIKIRGYRVELGEIENALLAIEDIHSGCVLAKKDKNNLDYLVGYVVFESAPINKNRIIQELKTSLPEYMIPKIWIEIEALPLTVNGKLDKKALPEVDNSLLTNKEYVAARTSTEKALTTIWQQLLSIEKIGIYDNFFELGGHSLLATRLVSAIRQEFEIDIAIREVFEHATIEGLGILIDLFKDTKNNEKDEEDFNEIIEI
ncbi:non-ribosomal peptide synthase/polyketide synthase [Tenacibaculum xiamenense]|uniref:non-ribosomal peptide synthase/polyketide synthase n=1 Tax=Tenacibaculum xiamenense TaxID=1261553 RepID=UPI00389602AE